MDAAAGHAVTGELLATHSLSRYSQQRHGTRTRTTETAYGHDAQVARIAVLAPGGTIMRTAFDTLGRVAGQWVGVKLAINVAA